MPSYPNFLIFFPLAAAASRAKHRLVTESVASRAHQV